MNLEDDLTKLIYGVKVSSLINNDLVKLIFTNKASYLKINNALNSLFFTVRGNEHLDKISIKSTVISLNIILILIVYDIRYLILINIKPKCYLSYILGDFMYPLDDARNWIYFMFIITVTYSIIYRLILLLFSLTGKNLNIFTDWKKESINVYNGLVDPLNIELERSLVIIYELSKIISVYSYLLFTSFVLIMFYVSFIDYLKVDLIFILITIIWMFSWFPALVFAVTGVIYPIFLTMCGVVYSIYKVNICKNLIDNFKYDQLTDSIENIKERKIFFSSFFKSTIELYLTIHRQGPLFRILLISFIIMTTLTAASLNFLSFYGKTSYTLVNKFISGLAFLSWFVVAAIPRLMIIIPNKVTKIYQQLTTLQIRNNNLTIRQKIDLLKLIESFGDSRHPIAYYINDNTPYTSLFHFNYLLNIITVIFLLINVYQKE